MNYNNQLNLFKKLTQNLSKIEAPAVIAGGAIANSLYNHQYPDQNAPINDIDIFVFYKRDTPLSQNQDGANFDYVGDISSAKNNLKITHTERKGIFNIIDVEVDELYHIKELGIQLLDQFDINATQALMTIEPNPQLITLPSFDEFLQNRQIKCVNPNTPVKTILRLLKKQKEFNCFLSEKHILSLFQYARYNNQKMMQETVEKFDTQIKQCAHLFKIYKLKKIIKNKDTNEETFEPIYKVFLNKDKFFDLHRNERRIIRKPKMRKFLLPIFDYYLENNAVYQKYLKIRPYYNILKTYCGQNWIKVLKNDFSPIKLVNLQKHLYQTGVLSQFIKLYNLTEAIYVSNYLDTIKKHENPFYLAFCGYLATSNSAIIPVVGKKESQTEKFLNPTLQSIFYFFKKELISRSLPYVEPIEIHHEYKDYVFELISQLQLDSESLKMGHCVNGYGSKIESKQCRIFSITTPEGNSTLEVETKADENGKIIFTGIQHRKEFNKFPAKHNRQIACSLINYLNTKVCDLEIDPDSGIDQSHLDQYNINQAQHLPF